MCKGRSGRPTNIVTDANFGQTDRQAGRHTHGRTDTPTRVKTIVTFDDTMHRRRKKKKKKKNRSASRAAVAVTKWWRQIERKEMQFRESNSNTKRCTIDATTTLRRGGENIVELVVCFIKHIWVEFAHENSNWSIHYFAVVTVVYINRPKIKRSQKSSSFSSSCRIIGSKSGAEEILFC